MQDARASRCPPVVLAAFYFLLAFKPSEPHLTYFLTNSKHFTDEIVNDRIYTVWTYAYFPMMVLVSLLLLSPYTKAPPLKTLIVIGTMGRLATRFLLLYGTTLFQMQLMQVVYAMGSVAESVFLAYTFAVTPNAADFVRVTSITQTAYLVSHVLSGIVGDLCLHAFHTSITFLFYLSAIGVGLALLIALFAFPPAVSSDTTSRREALRQELKCLAIVCRDRALVACVIWWLPAYTVYNFVYGYEASYYKDLRPHSDWNGTVLSVTLLAGALAVCVPATKTVENWLRTSDSAGADVLRVPPVVCGLGAVAAAALGCATEPDWRLALASLIVCFAAFAPLNAMVFALVARAVNRAALRSQLHEVPLLAVTASDDQAEPLCAVDSDDDGLFLEAGGVDDDKHRPRPYGAVFMALGAVSLGLQSLVSFVVYTKEEVKVVNSFRGFAIAQFGTCVVYGLVLLSCCRSR